MRCPYGFHLKTSTATLLAWPHDVKMCGMSRGYVGILSVELHFPESGSLKGKRRFLKSAKVHLHERYGASVAEVDHHDLWQRSSLTVACAASGHRELQQLLDAVVRYLGSQEFELLRADREVVVPGE